MFFQMYLLFCILIQLPLLLFNCTCEKGQYQNSCFTGGKLKHQVLVQPKVRPTAEISPEEYFCNSQIWNQILWSLNYSFLIGNNYNREFMSFQGCYQVEHKHVLVQFLSGQCKTFFKTFFMCYILWIALCCFHVLLMKCIHRKKRNNEYIYSIKER